MNTTKKQDAQKLLDLAESKIRAGVTAEEALKTFVGAGIMDADGNYTAPIQKLLREAGIDV